MSTELPPAPRAVFLSYASQDAEAARRIAEALRSSGVEVWFDKDKLVGGDAWDAKIRGQIASCALFMPVISAATQARLEGYFRVEWKLAAQRTHAMAEEKAFLLPVVIDDTRDAEAKVPGEFKAVQWTRLTGCETSEKFCMRVKALLGGSELEPGRPHPGERGSDFAHVSPDKEGAASPTRAKRRAPWLVPAIIGAVVLALAAFAILRPRRSPEEIARLIETAKDIGAKAGTATGAPPKTKSIAVLPFANRSDNRATEFFSDGISEELLNVLGKVPGLRVAGWTSALTFKGKNADAREIGEKLGVTHFVDGSVRQAGERVKITARLTRTDTAEQVWGETYDDATKDIFALQEKIARDIAQKLQLTLGALSRVASPVNPAAHQLVLEGRHYWNQRTEGELALAEEKFTRAVAMDPLFALAYAGLADACIMTALYAENNGAADVRQMVARGRAAAVRTRELDPTLAEPLAASAYAAAMEGDLAGADQYILKALAINPSHATAHQWRGVFLERQGRLEDALGEFETAVGLDPLAFVHQWMLGEALAFAGRNDEALRVLERSASLRDQTPFMPLIAQLALAELRAGRTESALARARSIRDRWPPKTRWWADGCAVWVMRHCGQPEEAEAYARALASKLAPESYQHGVVLSALGQFDEALPYLARTPQIARRILFWGELFDPFRDARMDELMRKLGCAEDYQRARESVAQMREKKQGEK